MRAARHVPRQGVTSLVLVCVLCLFVTTLRAQNPTGSIAGLVTDTSGNPITDAIAHLAGTQLGAKSAVDGSFQIAGVPAGNYQLVVTSTLGYQPDTVAVIVASGRKSDVVVRMVAGGKIQQLGPVIVTARRLGTTMAAALDQQLHAPNIINVMSGDEIRSLPNYNAAEAAGRIPGVSLERDEGEGKFVQVRGTDPNLTNVTVNGSEVPGTLSGDRSVKLDNVPSDILGEINVSKTLTADMPADAIGGSVDLVTKTPEDKPQGYVSGQYGQIDLLSRQSGQAGFTYGGRFGDDKAWGFLLGGSWDHTGRSINDVEPAWATDGAGASHPIEWSQRDYLYDRTRIGAGWDVDYRFNPQNLIFFKGMYNKFQNFGTRYVYDVASSDDSAGSGTQGYGTGVQLQRQVQWRAPTEQLYGMNLGGLHQFETWGLAYQLNYTGTTAVDNDYRTTTFANTLNNNITLAYNYANRTYPSYTIPNAGQAASSTDPTQYFLNDFGTSFDNTKGTNFGGNIDVLKTFQVGQNNNELKFGVRYRLQDKKYTQNEPSFDASGAPQLLSTYQSSFSDPNFYNKLYNGYTIGPVPDYGATKNYENQTPGDFTNTTDTLGNLAASYSGDEKILAGYILDNFYMGDWLLNVGLRIEQTKVDYSANAITQDTLGNTTVTPVTGTSSYIDWFPSLQLRYATAGNWNVRFAATRGISRPNYSDIAPFLQGTVDPTLINDYSNVSAGNPSLKAQTSWNYDFLVGKYFENVGVLSAGLFYKAISNVIFTRNFRYAGPYAPLVGYAGTQPQNGNTGHVQGIEIEWVQHFTQLPGWLGGFGIDANFTHSNSSAIVPCSAPGYLNSGCAVNGSDTTRSAALPRQAPNIANFTLMYDRSVISARIAWTYNDYSIYSYGDGSTSGETGDTYFYPHSQFDASLMWNVTRSVQLQFQILNITNEVFGFYNGQPSDHYNIQREYYGQTFFLGVRYGFVGY